MAQLAPAPARLVALARQPVVVPVRPRPVVALVAPKLRPVQVAVARTVEQWGAGKRVPQLASPAVARPVWGWVVPVALVPEEERQGGRQSPAYRPRGFCRLREN